MKVNYPVRDGVSLGAVKNALKPLGGRCAKIADGKLEYQISEEKEQEALNVLKEKGWVS